MNDRQRTFCEEYIIDLNAKEAAIRAGYSEKTAKQIGYENLTKPDLLEYVAKLKKERAENAKIDAEWVLERARDTFLAASKDEAHTAAVSALNLIGKHVDVKALVDRQEHTGKDGGAIEIRKVERVIVDGD